MQRKTPRNFCGVKKRLSETKDKLILRIPLVVRLSPIAVEPQTIVIVFKLEDVRITVGISCVQRVICVTVL